MIHQLIRPLAQALGLYILLLASGCEEEPPVTKPTAPNTNAPAAKPSGGAAQAKLPTIKLFLGAAELIAEVADENHERQAGMMHRIEMGNWTPHLTRRHRLLKPLRNPIIQSNVSRYRYRIRSFDACEDPTKNLRP